MNKIEHDIPVPLDRKGRPCKYPIPFDKMKPGDSYYLEGFDYRTIRNMQSSINTRAKTLGYEIVTRSDKISLRVWALKTPNSPEQQKGDRKMIVEIGGRGLENSWQAPFPKTVECVHCHKIAYPVMCIQEGDEKRGPEGDYICNLPPPPNPAEGEPPNSWPHDACAFAIYLCPKCFEATALFNQA